MDPVRNPVGTAASGRGRADRVLRFDLPGQGGSCDVVLPAVGDQPGGTTVSDPARLVLDLVDHRRAERFHDAGRSVGGAVGAHPAVCRPRWLCSLVLVCSSAHLGES